MKKLLLICLLLFQPFLTAGAAPSMQSHAQITKVVSSFIQQQTASLSGKVNYQIESIDERITLPACNAIEAFLPSGSQLIGKTSIGVRCNDKSGWTIFIPALIKITLDVLVSTHQLQVGHTLQPQDITLQSIEMSRPTGFTDPAQVTGKVLRYNISAGQILRDDMLRLPYSLTQGQVVQVVGQGNGFIVRNEGVALNNASEGQAVQVRVSSGRVIGGIARNGIVEASP